jgi:leucine-rich protein
MRKPGTKPEAILQLEYELGFKLTDCTDASSDTNAVVRQSKSYACNQEGEVIQLNLTGCELEEIPNLLAFEKLLILELSNNKVSRIEGLDKLPELQSLDLSLNRLTQIEGLEQLLNLQSLALGFNQLTRIEGLEQLTKLQSLQLWYNRLTRIEGLEQLTNLQLLNLLHNRLTRIEGLEQLPNLQLLNLRDNQLTSIEGLEKLTKLFSLDLSSNQLTSIEGLEKLTELSFLDLGNNQLTCIEELGKLSGLYSLNLGSNQLRSIEGLEHLPKLYSLNLSGNQLTSIEGLEHLSKLHSLNLSGNQLKSIEGLEALEELDELDFSDNQLSHAKGLESLSKLSRLNLSRNQLLKIEGLEPLSLLESLDLSSNQFSVIENLPQTSLKELKVEGNDIKYIRRDLSDKESEQLPCRLIFTPYENHLEDIQRFQKRKPLLQKLQLPIKVMLLGNHSSGKSTFLSSLCKGEKETGSTHVLRVVKRGDLGANFYDFGGQDFYHGIYNAFYSTGALYVLFWRLALDRNSRGEELLKDNNPHREKVLNFNRNYWLGQIRYTNQQRSIVGRDTSGRENVLVIQTYADCDPQQNLKQTDLSVREEFYIALEREIKGTKGQQSLFLQQDKAAKQYLRLRMKEEIARLKEKTSIDVTRSEKILYNYILQKKTSLGPDSPIPIEDLLNAMPGYTDSISSLKGDLHQLYLHGEVIYYKDDKELSDLVWLDPEATVNYIHSEILNKEFIKKRGVVEKYLLPNKDKNLVRLLELEKIIYYNKNEDQYIIPGYLPLADGDEMYEWLKLSYPQPNITLKFEHFIPFGLINQLICYYGQGENKLKKFWRDQLFFTLVNTPSEEKRIKQGSNGSLLYEEDRGPETYPKGRYMVWVSLNHEQLTIEVYIKPIDQGIEHLVSQVERMLLQDILDMYWSNLPPSNDERYLSRRRQKHWRLREKITIKDLYISTSKLPLCQERRLFVNLASIDNYDPDKEPGGAGVSRGLAVGYPLNEDGTLDKGQAQPISLRSFQHLTDNKHIGKMKKVFISYSKDDKAELKVCLQFFKPLEDEGLVTIYYDERTEAGAEIHPTIRKEITEADVIVVLVSPSLLSTDYITRLELPLAKELGKRIYPFILKPCMWEDNKIIKPVYVALKGETGASEEVYIDKGSGAYVSESIQFGVWKKFMEEFKKKVLHINT